MTVEKSHHLLHPFSLTYEIVSYKVQSYDEIANGVLPFWLDLLHIYDNENNI